MKIVKAALLTILALASQSSFANTEVEKSGKIAASVIESFVSAGIPSSDGSDDGVGYHVWNLSCHFRMAERTIVEPACVLELGPSERAPELSVSGKKALSLIRAVMAAGAASVVDAEDSSLFQIALLNVDAATSVHGVDAYRLQFVDLNK